MDKDWIAVIGTVMGAIVGGLLQQYAGRSAFVDARNWERDKFLQQKLEEIYVLAREIRRSIVKVFYEAIHYKEIKDDDREGTKKELLAKIRHFRLLVWFYAPEEMQSYANALTSLYNEDVLQKIMDQAKDGSLREAGDQFSKREGPIREAGNNFQSQLVKLARERLRVHEAWSKRKG